MKLLSYLWKELNTFPWNGVQPSTAYDTAWVSSLVDGQNKPLFDQSLFWILHHQNPDGSWGTNDPYFFICEQMTATLASLRSLSLIDKEKYSKAIDKGINWVNLNIKDLNTYLKSETVKTVGFELIFPSLLDSVNSRLNFGFNSSTYIDLRNSKLDKIPLSFVSSTKTPLLYSIEFLDGMVKKDKINLDYLIGNDGSISSSPSATSFYAALKPKTFESLYYYLERSQNSDGGWPAFKNGDLFIIAYSLYIIQKSLGFIPSHFKYLLSILQINLTPLGLGVSNNFATPDLDDTVLALKVLSDNKFLKPRQEMIAWNAIDSYFSEDKGYFVAMPWENDPSFLVNLHVLDALQSYQKKKDQYFETLLSFLEKKLHSSNSFSIDKYHYSPYLQNSRAILILSDINRSLTDKILGEILKSQRGDGLWGEHPNVEELAQVVLALSYYNLHVEKIDLSVLDSSIKFITENFSDKNFQKLWIAKSLYSPTEIVTSNMFASFSLYEKSIKKKNYLKAMIYRNDWVKNLGFN